MKYRIVELNANAFMAQRSLDGSAWHDGTPEPAPTEEIARLYVASMREFDARNSAGVVVWHSDVPDREQPQDTQTVMRFEDFLD